MSSPAGWYPDPARVVDATSMATNGHQASLRASETSPSGVDVANSLGGTPLESRLLTTNQKLKFLLFMTSMACRPAPAISRSQTVCAPHGPCVATHFVQTGHVRLPSRPFLVPTHPRAPVLSAARPPLLLELTGRRGYINQAMRRGEVEDTIRQVRTASGSRGVPLSH
jgi:hypothetical protein